MKKIMTIMLSLLLIASMVMPAAAATDDFVSSIEIKPGPGVVDTPTTGGEPAFGVIVLPDGTEVVIPEGSIIITPIGGKEDADEETQKALEDAYNDLKNSQTLDELIDNLQDILDQIAPGTEVKDLVITDIFHVDLDDEYEKYLDQGGVLKITIKSDADLIASLLDANGEWNTLFGDKFVDNGDGTYTMYITDLGVFALFKDAGSVDVDPDKPGVSSPTTSDNTLVLTVAGSVFALAAVLFFALSKKQEA